jgi:hypothetical protein
MDGIDRSMVVTIRRSSGKTDTSRVTRSSRARRATIANGPALGSSEQATTVKSNTFQPSRKKRPGREPWASSRIAISSTKMVWTTISITSKSVPYRATRDCDVSSPMTTAVARITTRIAS